MAKKVSIVVTVLNEEPTMVVLLTALVQQTHLPDEIIIVDGGSHDQTIKVIRDFVKTTPIKITVFTKKGNRSVGRNYGVDQAQYEFIAFTDAGCIPHHDWLAELLKVSTDHTVVAGYYDAITTTPFEQAVVPYVLVMPDRVNPTTFLPATRSMMVPKQLFQRWGGFDETLSDNEDYAFAKQLEKLKSAGEINIIFAEQAKVSWLPRTTLVSFGWMVYRFARGDIQAGIIRPKVLAIFGRYFGGVGLIVSLWLMNQTTFAFGSLLLGGIVYICWAIYKNYRYVIQGWYWLPILQFVSDGAVMMGSIAGILR